MAPSTHFGERMMQRGVRMNEVYDAYNDPSARISYDPSRGTFRFEGTNGVTLIVARDGDMVTTWRR